MHTVLENWFEYCGTLRRTSPHPIFTPENLTQRAKSHTITWMWVRSPSLHSFHVFSWFFLIFSQLCFPGEVEGRHPSFSHAPTGATGMLRSAPACSWSLDWAVTGTGLDQDFSLLPYKVFALSFVQHVFQLCTTKSSNGLNCPERKTALIWLVWKSLSLWFLWRYWIDVEFI